MNSHPAVVRHVSKRFAVPVLTFVALSLLPGQTPAVNTPAQARSEAKPLSIDEISLRIPRTASIVRRATRDANPLSRVEHVEQSLPAFADGIEELLGVTEELLTTQRSVSFLSEIRTGWSLVRRRLDDWMAVLTARSRALQSDAESLRREAALWSATKDVVSKQQLPAESAAAIARAEALLAAAEKIVVGRRNVVLKLQNKITDLFVELDRLDEDMTVALEAERGRMLRVDAPPIWRQAPVVPKQKDAVGAKITGTSHELEVLRFYLESVVEVLAIRFSVIAALLIVLAAFRRRLTGGDLATGSTRLILARPFSFAFMLAILAGVTWQSQTPQLLIRASWYVMLIPLLRVAPVLWPGAKGPVWLLAGLYVADGLVAFSPAEATPTRLWILAVTSATGATLIWHWRRVSGSLQGQWLKLHRAAVRFASLLLLISMLAELAGATTLSRFLLGSVLKSIYASAVLYMVLQVLSAATDILLSSRWAGVVHSLSLSAGIDQTRLGPVASRFALVAYAYVILSSFQLQDDLLRALRMAAGYEVSLGALRFELSSAFAFSAILATTILVSRTLRHFLSLGLYSHLQMQVGTGEAISKLVHYAVLTAGFFLALLAGGIDLNRFTVLAGGLGVGLAFGLQNIVSNFVSGLILLFERPLHVGDKVTVGSTFGEVRDIGIRAITIHTFDGADVIIPNASLITGDVVNWTLSDDRRRAEVRVGVAYGTAPERVIAVLEQAARNDARVLPQPAPAAHFVAMSDSTLDFVLRYWTVLDHYLDVNSAVHAAVYERLTREGIEIPFPQRDLNIKSMSPDLAHALTRFDSKDRVASAS